jgi:hypothetical protein
LLGGTRFAPPFGQSPFAFRRGNTFEERLRRDGHQPLLDLLVKHLHYPSTDAKVANLRDQLPPSKARAARTEELIRAIVRRDTGAPNLIDGAVLIKEIGGLPSFFEAAAVAASFGGLVHAGEKLPTYDEYYPSMQAHYTDA